MARPLRIEFPGACCHLIYWGNFRFPSEEIGVSEVSEGTTGRLCQVR